MKSMPLIFSILTLILIMLTVGCGFAVHCGGDAFKSAVRGHTILGILTLIAGICTVVSVFLTR